jgi:hypothetical protein
MDCSKGGSTCAFECKDQADCTGECRRGSICTRTCPRDCDINCGGDTPGFCP